MDKTRRRRPINKKRSKTNRNRNRSNRSRKYLGGTHSPTKSMHLVPFSGQELTRSSINEEELTLSNISSSRIFEGFYSTMHSFFPDLKKRELSKVFLMFITTTDFSEFLQFMPDFKDLSVLEMNKFMVVASEQLRNDVIYEITGKSIGPTSTHGNQRRIMSGGDITLIMIHTILAMLVAIGLPDRYKYIFAGLIICFFMFNILKYRHNPDDYVIDADTIFPLLGIEGGVVAVAGIEATYEWVQRIIGYALSFFRSGRVQDLSRQTVSEVQDTPAPPPPPQRRRQSLYLDPNQPERRPRSILPYSPAHSNRRTTGARSPSPKF